MRSLVTDTKSLIRVRRVVAIMEELRGVAPITFFQLPSQHRTGQEQHLDICADRDACAQSAWGAAVNTEGAKVRYLLREGAFPLSPSLPTRE
jgi:hypothetical protein